MNTMGDKLDFIFPTLFGAGGGMLGAITFGGMLQTAISAAIFALVGGVIGFFVAKLMKKLDK